MYFVLSLYAAHLLVGYTAMFCGILQPPLHPPSPPPLFKVHPHTSDEVPGAPVGGHYHSDCLLLDHVPLKRVSASWHSRRVPGHIWRTHQGKDVGGPCFHTNYEAVFKILIRIHICESADCI